MANWTAGGFVGKMLKTVSRFIAPSGMPSPLFPPSDVVNFFRLNYGPVNRAFACLDRAGRKGMHWELEAIWSMANRGRDGLTLVPAEYLEVIATRV